jgi:hypothetical protein
VAQRPPERRVAEHRRGGHRQVEQQPLHHRRVVEHPLVQRGQGRQALGLRAAPEAPAQGGGGVVAEVERVAPVDAFEEELDLEPLQREVRRGGVRLRLRPGDHR